MLSVNPFCLLELFLISSVSSLPNHPHFPPRSIIVPLLLIFLNIFLLALLIFPLSFHMIGFIFIKHDNSKHTVGEQVPWQTTLEALRVTANVLCCFCAEMKPLHSAYKSQEVEKFMSTGDLYIMWPQAFYLLSAYRKWVFVLLLVSHDSVNWRY